LNLEPETDKKVDIMEVIASYTPLISKTIEGFIPRQFNDAYISNLVGKPSYENDALTLTKAISEPCWEILDRGGKRWRSVLVLLLAEVLGKKAEEIVDFILITEIVHNGTLVIDDIEDSSELRRGKPCLHLVYPPDLAINCGNAMYYLPMYILRKMRGTVPDDILLRCHELYSQELLALHFGQGMDIYWHSGKGEKDPSVNQYLQMCAYKTGTLARLSAKLAALVCGANEEEVEAIGKFAEVIGVAFQIQDDILNIVGEKFSEMKGVGEDIHEGKRTLMVLHSLQHGTEQDSKRLREILLQHPSDQKIILEAIDLIKKTKSVEYATQMAKALVSKAWKDVEPIFKASLPKQKLEAFSTYLIEREI